MTSVNNERILTGVWFWFCWVGCLRR